MCLEGMCFCWETSNKGTNNLARIEIKIQKEEQIAACEKQGKWTLALDSRELGDFCLLVCESESHKILVLDTLGSWRSARPKAGQARWLCPWGGAEVACRCLDNSAVCWGYRCVCRCCCLDQKDHSSLGVWRSTKLDPSISLLWFNCSRQAQNIWVRHSSSSPFSQGWPYRFWC